MVYPAAGMLVMAIEAANQMADPTQTVVGFEIKDASFLRSLTIPQDTTGIETQLSLHLLQNTFTTSNSWAEFRICAFENDEWHECCRGSIRLEYEVGSNQVDGGKEKREELRIGLDIDHLTQDSCHLDMDPTVLYESLNNSGFGFGPAFQPISNATFGDSNESHADIRLFEWPSEQFPQPHVVHPTSLDGMLHLAIAGYAKGGKKPVPTMIPTLLRNLWISKTGLNYTENPNVCVSTWMTAEDNRGTEFDASVLDPSKTAVLAQIRGLRLTIIADAASDPVESQTPQVCYHVETLPDPDFLTTEQVLEHSKPNVSVRTNLTDSADYDALVEYLDLLGHKSPRFRILEVGSRSSNMTTQIMQGFATQDSAEEKHYRYDSYHYTGISQTDIDQVREDLAQYPRLTFGILDLNNDLASQGYEIGSYDIVFTTNAISMSENSRAVLENLSKLLAPGGRLIARVQNLSSSLHSSFVSRSQDWNAATSMQDWQRIYEENGFSSFSLKIHDDPSRHSDHSVVVATASTPNPKMQQGRRIVLVSDPSSDIQSQLSENLTQKLKSNNLIECSTISISDIESLVNIPKIIFIFLLEVDAPFLYNLSEKIYPVLKKFLISAKDILWISPHGGTTVQKPEFALANGLARALRNEYEDLRFTTLALDFQDNISERQLGMISKVLSLNHMHEHTLDCEPEYIEISGRLNIQRLVQSTQLGTDIYKRSLPQQSASKTIKEAPPLCLTIGSPGLLDTLHFVEDTTISETLGEDEVEIETYAVGMNFKDCLIALGQIPGTTCK